MILSVRSFRNVPWGINGGVFALITRDLNHFTYANLSYYTIFFLYKMGRSMIFSFHAELQNGFQAEKSVHIFCTSKKKIKTFLFYNI